MAEAKIRLPVKRFVILLSFECDRRAAKLVREPALA
jgi:hypothetical protein